MAAVEGRAKSFLTKLDIGESLEETLKGLQKPQETLVPSALRKKPLKPILEFRDVRKSTLLAT